MFSLNLNILACLVILCVVRANSQQVHRRFEYKYSFKPPYLAQKDGSVPFWEYGGNAIASGESVRLAPSLRSQKGAIWTKSPVPFEWWEVDLMFKVTGRGRVGADGLALWYTLGHGQYGGEVFGAPDRWSGLGLFFDSFDNDNKHNNPYIMAVLNDGTKTFDHKSDGATQLVSGCLRDFRNKPFPTRARVEYYLNTLTVYFHNGMTNNEADYELCFRAENVVLPKGGYFGVSAATGGLADDHDVIHFLATSLHQQINQKGAPELTAEQARIAAEFQEYQRQLDQHKEDYRKDHPDQAHDKDEEEWFESDGQRELRQIFQGQAHIHDTLRDINKKVDEVVGKQMNTLSMLTAVYSQTQGAPAAAPGAPAVPPPQLAGGLPVGRGEWDALAANSQILINTVAELKGFIIDVSRKTDSMLAGGAAGGAGGAGGAGAQLAGEVRASLEQLKQQLASLERRSAAVPMSAALGGGEGAGGAGGAGCGGCAGTATLLTVAATQLILMFFYAIYKEKKEAQAKKFF